jgi:hypothetical protein
MSLVLISRDSTLACCYKKWANSMAPLSPMKRSLMTIRALSLKDSKRVWNDMNDKFE